jgi:hypothetical protein
LLPGWAATVFIPGVGVSRRYCRGLIRRRIQNRSGCVCLVELPEEIIGNLISYIEELINQGVLNAGQGNSLIVKLDQALKQLEKAKTKQAIKAINAFINEVNSLYMEGVLPEETANQLVEDAEFIIDSIESG